MSGPALTVGIPFHNEERFLHEAITSVLRQTMADFELVLIDDGSTDRSVEIARRFSDDARVRVVVDGRRLGLPARLNQIIRTARGALVARMDADDICHPTRFERELGFLRRDLACDAVGTWIALVDDGNEPIAISEYSTSLLSPKDALTRGLLPHATIVGRREWFIAHPYNESLTRAEDRELSCRTVSTSRLTVVAEPLYVVRIHSRGPDFLADYLESQRQNRRLYARFGPAMLGRAGVARAYAASFAKSVVMVGAVQLGVANRLVRRRGRPPTNHERRLIREALEAVR